MSDEEPSEATSPLIPPIGDAIDKVTDEVKRRGRELADKLAAARRLTQIRLVVFVLIVAHLVLRR